MRLRRVRSSFFVFFFANGLGRVFFLGLLLLFFFSLRFFFPFFFLIGLIRGDAIKTKPKKKRIPSRHAASENPFASLGRVVGFMAGNFGRTEPCKKNKQNKSETPKRKKKRERKREREKKKIRQRDSERKPFHPLFYFFFLLLDCSGFGQP